MPVNPDDFQSSTDGWHHFHHDSMYEFCETAVAGTKSKDRLYTSSTKVHSREWTGTETFNDAVKLVNDGWSGAQDLTGEDGGKFADIVRNIEAPFGISRARAETAISGGFVDVQRHISGVPDCMRKFKPIKRVSKPVMVVSRGSYHCGTQPEVFEWNGAAALAATRILREANIPAELVLLFCVEATGRGGREMLVDTVTLQSSHNRVPLRQLAFPLCHRSTLRRLGFGVWEGRSKATQRAMGSNYGRPHDVSAHEMKAILGVSDDMPLLMFSDKKANKTRATMSLKTQLGLAAKQLGRR